MTPAARLQAAIEILDDIGGGKPAEQALTGWARRSRFAGSKDRAAVRDHVFDVLRQRQSCAALGGAETGRALVLGLLRCDGVDPETMFTGQGHAPAPLTDAERAVAKVERPLDLPGWLLPELQRSLGDDLPSVARALRHRAPVHLRVNSGKTDLPRAQATLLAEGIETTPHPGADTALEVTQGARKLRQSAAYADGLVELQDAASQAVVAGIPALSGLRVLDYCAGGGGKALALAAAGAQVDAHDIAPDRMQDLPARATRAGVRVRCVTADQFDAAYDAVLCDAPCSGSGAWRRAPDGKWRLTPQRLAELTATQDQILHQAAGLVRPGGLLIYATCSLLAVENQDRAQAFLAAHPGWSMTHTQHWSPTGGTDGFFTAQFQRPAA